MRNIYDFSSLYRRTITVKSDATTPFFIKLDPVPSKVLRVLTHATVENKSAAYTKVRLGINQRGFIHYIDELITVAANELAVSRSDIILGDGDIFFTELIDTGDKNILVFSCIGWEQDL